MEWRIVREKEEERCFKSRQEEEKTFSGVWYPSSAVDIDTNTACAPKIPQILLSRISCHIHILILSITLFTTIYCLYAAWLRHPRGLDSHQKGACKHVHWYADLYLIYVYIYVSYQVLLFSRLWLHWVPTEGRLTLTAPCSRSDQTETGPFSTAEEHTHTVTR